MAVFKYKKSDNTIHEIPLISNIYTEYEIANVSEETEIVLTPSSTYVETGAGAFENIIARVQLLDEIPEYTPTKSRQVHSFRTEGNAFPQSIVIEPIPSNYLDTEINISSPPSNTVIHIPSGEITINSGYYDSSITISTDIPEMGFFMDYIISPSNTTLSTGYYRGSSLSIDTDVVEISNNNLQGYTANDWGNYFPSRIIVDVDELGGTYIDDGTAADSSHILAGKKAYVDGDLLIGEMPINTHTNNNVVSLGYGETFDIAEGYHDGGQSIEVVIPTINTYAPTITTSNYNISTILNKYVEDVEITVPVESLDVYDNGTYLASTNGSFFNEIYVEVDKLGGTYITSGTPATSDDILLNKRAYINGELLIGTIPTSSWWQPTVKPSTIDTVYNAAYVTSNKLDIKTCTLYLRDNGWYEPGSDSDTTWPDKFPTAIYVDVDTGTSMTDNGTYYSITTNGTHTIADSDSYYSKVYVNVPVGTSMTDNGTYYSITTNGTHTIATSSSYYSKVYVNVPTGTSMTDNGTYSVSSNGTYTIANSSSYYSKVSVTVPTTTSKSGTFTGKRGYTMRWEQQGSILLIRGYDYIPDFSDSYKPPWWNDNDEITKVIIGNGVWGIGDYSFYWNENIREVQIGQRVDCIGTYAFADIGTHNSSTINSIDIPRKCFYVGPYAFKNVNVEKLTISSEDWSGFSNTSFSGLTVFTTIECPWSSTNTNLYGATKYNSSVSVSYNQTMPNSRSSGNCPDY